MTQSCEHSFRRRGGFTLVEMLVVLGIILLLIGIIVPAINKAYTNAVRVRMADDLQAIVTALEHYKSEHGDIPRTSGNGDTPQLKGAIVLCRAMVGPGAQGQDGADGPGFRTIRAVGTDVQGRVYGPYLPADRFKIVAYPAGGQPAADYSNAALADRNGKPILYYPGLPASDPRSTTTAGYVANATYTGTPTRPMFNAADNDAAMNITKLQHMLGDWNHNGRIDGNEQPEYVGEYILLGGGPDQIYGPLTLPPSGEPLSSKFPCDDVANFPR